MKTEFYNLLLKVREFITKEYASLLNNKGGNERLIPYIEKYLNDSGYKVRGMTRYELVDKLKDEMSGYSILTKYLESEESETLEEINVNSWNDVSLIYTDGKKVKIKEQFLSPQHAEDIIKRLLQHSDMTIDRATPIAQGHLSENKRIAAIISPVVDSDAGVSASIRFLHTKKITRDMIIESNTATEEMIDFLIMCLKYGVSMIIVGRTSSGKTTLLNCLLGEIEDEKRIYTIESGSREFSLVKKDENGKILNNVVHTLSKPSDDKYDISQEKLLVTALRFHPDLIAVGEIRDTEAAAAVEAANTGHTTVSTVHALSKLSAHTRIAELCIKKYNIDYNIALRQAQEAFPIVVYAKQLDDNSRKIMDISECNLSSGTPKYKSLYSYKTQRNEIINGKVNIVGNFSKPHMISDELYERFIENGLPEMTAKKYRKPEVG